MKLSNSPSRKYLFILMMTFICILSSLSATDNHFQLLQQTQKSISLQFNLGQWSVSTTRANGTEFQSIDATGANFIYIDETATLPTYSTLVAIPEGMDVKVRYSNQTDDFISSFRMQSENLLTSNLTANGFYPAEQYVVSAPAQLRDFRVVNVTVNPFRYNTQSQNLTVVSTVNIELELIHSNGESYNNKPGFYSKSFDSIYRSMIINYDNSRDQATPLEQSTILIVYPTSSDATFLAKLDQFVAWKRQKGHIVYTASTTTTGTSTTSIKNYVQNAYNTWTDRPDFLILLGDVGGTFAIPTYTISYYSAEGDNPYTQLAGSDNYSDLAIGRISISTTTEFSVYVAKVLAYEKTINTSTAQWLDRMLLVGDQASSGISTIYTNRYIHDISDNVNPNYTYTELYQSSPSVSAMESALNTGVGFFNYRGYIGMSGFTNTNITNLVNSNKLPHAVIITCDTGSFSSGTARTEAFIRRGTETTMGGSVTAIGMSTSGTHTAFNNFLCGGVFDGIFNYGLRTMGEAQMYSKNALFNVYGVSNLATAQNFAHLCNLMGDPSMEVFVTIPSTFSLSAPGTILTGTNTVEITVKNASNVVVPNATVNLYQTTNCNVTGFTDATGKVVLTIPATLTGSLTLTVSKHDYKPSQQTITISGTGLVFQASVIDDDNSGSSLGNGNQIINAGETIEYKVQLRNSSAASITTITGDFSFSDSNIQLLTGTRMSFPTAAANSTVNSTTTLRFYVKPDCPNNHPTTFYVTGNSSAGAWSVAIPILIKSPDLDYSSYNVVDSGNLKLDPGETSNFTLAISNSGTESATNVYAILRSGDYAVSVTDSTAYLGTIAAGTTYTNSSDMFTLYARSIALRGMTIPMEVYLYNANGYSDTETFTLTIGQAALTDPLGQDAYGYYIYDDGDVDYTDHPTYQWVGIAPAEGGSGTLLTMTDSSVDGTEGDTDNADAVETFTLPFTFRFYGVDYTQMTVCSNGYIAMGTTLNGDFRNGRLPGVNGPNPMIAPFWDDLVIQTGGGVYRYYDAANHRLIIEWYNLKNGDNTSMSETFQAIFYDPSYYPTSTMDGAIKIQYQTFNNVDAGSSSTHGNYATIGIKNHTGMVGLEYSFNNQYPTAAKPITNGTAIYITTKPIIPNTPMLTIGQTLIFDPNDNGFVEPGETINLGIRLGNAGSGAASNVSATLSESDPYITLTQAVSNYGTITGLGSGLNTAYFTLSVAANCPADYIATLQLTITATGGYSWVRNLSIQVHKPTVVLESWMVDDIATNANNTIDPGETCYLVMNLKNEEAVAIENLNVTLSSNNASLVLATPTLTISEIAGTKRQQIVTSVTAGAGMTIGTTVIITLNVTSANGAPYATTITTVIGLNNTSYNFETTNGGFTAVNSITPGWDWGTSTYAGAHGGTKIWGCVLSGQYGNSATYELISPAVTVGSSSTLTFWHRWAFENSYDGGRLFASTDNGVNWTAITPTGGYPNTPSVFGGAGYGNSNTTWTQATFSLSAFASQSVKIKWQMMTDGSVVNYGWFIDDVAISNSNGFGAVGIVNGTVSLSAHSENMTSVKVAANDLIVTPAVSGAYRLRLPAGTYIITGSCDSYSTATGNASVTNNGTVNGVNLSLEYLSSVLQLTWMVQDNQINLRWTSDGRPTLQHYNVYRKAGADTWVQIAETNQTTYTENLTQQTWFDYRVTAQYTTGESVPSEIISLVYPNNNTDIAPASPASVTITKTATQITVAWQPVTTDVNGNPITPWGYKVYASSTPDFVPSPLNYLGMSTNSSWTDTITPGSSKLFYKVLATIGYLN